MVTKGGTLWKHHRLLASKVGGPREILLVCVRWSEEKRVTVRVRHVLFTQKALTKKDVLDVGVSLR